MTKIKASDVLVWNRGQVAFDDLMHLTNYQFEVGQCLDENNRFVLVVEEDDDEESVKILFPHLHAIVTVMKFKHRSSFSLTIDDDAVRLEVSINYGLSGKKHDFLDHLADITHHESRQERDAFIGKKIWDLRVRNNTVEENKVSFPRGNGHCGICFDEDVPVFKPNNGCQCKPLLCAECLEKLMTVDIADDNDDVVTVTVDYRCPWCRCSFHENHLRL